uniref:Uncharacterized protein n=1 Tax=Anguilla anguilla TaxID=7936 RepID=A0A0E9Q012_ANGAN
MGLVHETCVPSHLIVNRVYEHFQERGIHNSFFSNLYLFVAASLC